MLIALTMSGLSALRRAAAALSVGARGEPSPAYRSGRRSAPVVHTARVLGGLWLALHVALGTAPPAAAASFKDCWDTVKGIAELHKEIGEAAAKYIENPECAAHYENPAFFALAGSLAAMRLAGGPDCEDASVNKVIAAWLDKVDIPLLDSDTKKKIHQIAVGESQEALDSIPGLNFFSCACTLSTAEEDVRKFIMKTQEVLEEGKGCLEAIGEAILSVPGFIGKGVEFLADLLGSIPGLGELIDLVGDLIKGAACSNAVTGAIYEAFASDDCDDEPSPEDKLRDRLHAQLAELCHDASLTDAEIEALAKKAGGSFGEKCKGERDAAKDESSQRLCESTGGWWVGGPFAICSCPPGKAHTTWCEPEPCPPPFQPPIVR